MTGRFDRDYLPNPLHPFDKSETESTGILSIRARPPRSIPFFRDNPHSPTFFTDRYLSQKSTRSSQPLHWLLQTSETRRLTNPQKNKNPLKTQATILVAVGVILVALIVACMNTENMQKTIFVVLYYLLTTVSVFMRRRFDQHVERFTGKKRTVSAYIDLGITLSFAFLIHWLLFWD